MNFFSSNVAGSGCGIGNTPVLRLELERERVCLFAKCEYQNPGGSIKDRFALAVIEDAERRGLLGEQSTILEYSTGNTGVALAMVGAARGHRVKIVMPRGASQERRNRIEQLGGEVVTFKAPGTLGGPRLVREMAAANPRYFLPRQSSNPLGAAAHEFGTGAEILRQVEGPIDALVAGYRTGGTLAGVSRALRRRNPSMQVYLMEHTESGTPLGEGFGSEIRMGRVDSFVPPLLIDVRPDGVIKVPVAEATAMARSLQNKYGLAVGIFSGANVIASIEVAKRLGPRARIVTLLCDAAERVLWPGAPYGEAVPAPRIELAWKVSPLKEHQRRAKLPAPAVVARHRPELTPSA